MVVVPKYSFGFIYIYIYNPGKMVSLLLCRFICVQITKVHYDPMVLFVCLHITPPYYHLYADLSECIELRKCLSGTFCLVCVSKIVSVLSIIVHAINGAVGIQLTHSLYGDRGNTCTLSYRHQIGSMTHLPFLRLGHEMVVCAVSFYIILKCISSNFGYWTKCFLSISLSHVPQPCLLTPTVGL